MLADARTVTLAGVAAASVVNPSFGLRSGAVLAALLVITRLGAVRIQGGTLWAGLYAALAVLSLGWTEAPHLTERGVLNIGACVVLFVAARVAIQCPRDVRLIAGGIVAGALVGVLRLVEVAGEGSRVRWYYDPAATRVGLDGINYNATAYGFATAMALLTIFWVTAQRRKPAFCGVLAVSAALYVGVLLNGTRGAIIAVLGLGVWLVVSRMGRRVAFVGLLVVVLGGSALSMTGWIDGWLEKQVGGISTREAGDLNGRLALWPIARDLIAVQPLFGHGADAFPALNPFGIDAHNAILDVSVGLGLLGLCTFARVLYLAVLVEPREWAHPRRVAVTGAFIVVTAPILLSGFWIESPVMWLSLGVVSRLGALNGLRQHDNHSRLLRRTGGRSRRATRTA